MRLYYGRLSERLVWTWRVTIAATKIRVFGIQSERVCLEANHANRPPLPSSVFQHAALTMRLPWSNCLSRSIAICAYASKNQYRAQVVIGQQKQGNQLASHAWITPGPESNDVKAWRIMQIGNKPNQGLAVLENV